MTGNGNLKIADLFHEKNKKKISGKTFFEELKEIADSKDAERLKEFVTQYDDERIQFGAMNPVDVCRIVAEKIDGESSRVDIKNPESTPIVIKEVNGIRYSVVYFKSSRSFAIYKLDDYGKSRSHSIASRNTSFGLKMAFENIRDGLF
jgi:hypothetical protein